MPAEINDTSDYHINLMETLGWEQTVCNTLECENSPCRRFLENNTTYGNLLQSYFSTLFNLSEVKKVLEVGGGYGYLMRDLLLKNSGMRAVMADISPFLLKKQRETLSGFNVEFIRGDFFALSPDYLSDFDLVIMNEMIGDLPAVCNINADNGGEKIIDLYYKEANEIINKYDLETPESGNFNLNTGALRAVELLCGAKVKYIFLSEHSCEADSPVKYRCSNLKTIDGFPERIKLKGHDEFSIKFSHLESIAGSYNYQTVRNSYIDFIALKESPELNFILAGSSDKDAHEAVRHFVDDLYIYESLVLVRQ